MVNQNNSKKRLLYKISCAVGCLILFLIMGVATYILHDISEIDEPLEYSASLEFNKDTVNIYMKMWGIAGNHSRTIIQSNDGSFRATFDGNELFYEIKEKQLKIYVYACQLDSDNSYNNNSNIRLLDYIAESKKTDFKDRDIKKISIYDNLRK